MPRCFLRRSTTIFSDTTVTQTLSTSLCHPASIRPKASTTTTPVFCLRRSSIYSDIISQMRDHVILFRRSRASGSVKTTCPSFLRSISPSAETTSLPKVATTSLYRELPCLKASCPTLSASITTAPSSARYCAMVLFPLPIPPVKPITVVITSLHRLLAFSIFFL